MSEKNKHWGSSLDDFLHDEGIYEAAKVNATMTLTENIKMLLKKRFQDDTEQTQALADLVAEAQKLEMGY